MVLQSMQLNKLSEPANISDEEKGASSSADDDGNPAGTDCDRDSPASLKRQLHQRDAELLELRRENKRLKTDLSKACGQLTTGTLLNSVARASSKAVPAAGADKVDVQKKAEQLKLSIEKALHAQMAYKKSMKHKNAAFKVEMPNVDEGLAKVCGLQGGMGATCASRMHFLIDRCLKWPHQ